MTRIVKDAAATGLTALIVLVFVAVHQSWGVPLVGGSVRWAAGAILLLGALSCGLGEPQKGRGTKLFSVLGATALVLGAVALVAGSLTALSLLVTADVVLWLAATARHAHHTPGRWVTA
jgi:hypothetical protein